MLKEFLGIGDSGKSTTEDAVLATVSAVAGIEVVAATGVVVEPVEAIVMKYPNGIAINPLVVWLWAHQLTLATQVCNLLASLSEAWPTGYGDTEIESMVARWKSLGWVA